MRTCRKSLKWVGFLGGIKMKKTFKVWLVLEETEDDSPLHQLQTSEIASCQTETEAETIFETVQDLAFAIKNRLGIVVNY